MNNALHAVVKFFELSDEAAELGGFWVSQGKGTVNVLAGVFCEFFPEITHDQMKGIIENVGKAWVVSNFKNANPDDWYDALLDIHGSDRYKRNWSAIDIAKSACKGD